MTDEFCGILRDLEQTVERGRENQLSTTCARRLREAETSSCMEESLREGETERKVKD